MMTKAKRRASLDASIASTGICERFGCFMELGMPTLSVVVPFHNEEGKVTELYSRLHAVMQGLDWSHQFIFVDDGSIGPLDCLSFGPAQHRPNLPKVIGMD